MMQVLDNYTQTILKGEVIHGRQIGRTIGFPTANLHVKSEDESSLLKGVYGVKVHHENTYYNGVMNIGMRPTFKDEKEALSFEVHILHFNQDIYGEQLKVDILFFIREEQAFNSIDQLVQQLNLDIEQANKRFHQ
ncbi:riboflavin kinase [Peribacillus butanolivorans]|uniref:riboflavin kinase n=1 Tax=Peribacillus butanolivorans TaxID=421767 RepID=UPI0036524F55